MALAHVNKHCCKCLLNRLDLTRVNRINLHLRQLSTHQWPLVNDYQCLAVNQRTVAHIRLILAEYRYFRESGSSLAPRRLTVDQMKWLMRCWDVRHTKPHHYWVDKSSLVRKMLMAGFWQEEQDWDEGDGKLTLSFNKSHVQRFFVSRLIESALLGQNLVVDLSYDHLMSESECHNCAQQLWRIYFYNRFRTRVPFNLHFCNVDRSQSTFKHIANLFPIFEDSSDFLMNITSRSYLDLFDRQQLLFLSPHADEELTEFDHSAVLIVGGLVDRKQIVQVTDTIAKQSGIRSVRLPLDKLALKNNVQSIDDVVEVLHDLKYEGWKKTWQPKKGEHDDDDGDIDWDKILRKRLPKYKLKRQDQLAVEELREMGIDRDQVKKLVQESEALLKEDSLKHSMQSQ